MRNFLISLFICSVFWHSAAYASVVMNGTRVIFPAEFKETTVKFRNPDQQLYIVQVQIDNKDDEDSDEGSSSFVVTPQYFRMEPGSGQAVRLKYVGTGLPEDRESLFFLKFTQLPVIKKSEQSGSQLILAVTSRVKLFYRPKGLVGESADTAKSLKFSLNGKHIKVTNPTGYFAVIKKASLLIDGKEIGLADSVIVAPKTDMEWTPSSPVPRLSGGRLRLVLVNDYGAGAVSEIKL